ncbi:MAG: HIT family protein [Actinopolymorphaceae bacterium]
MSPCVFCGVVSHDVDARVIREDAGTVAFMDLRQPIWPEGVHVLVIPKQHVEQVDELDPEVAAALMTAVVSVARVIRRHFAPEGISVWSSNGPAAFQEVPHVHMHVLTRKPDDSLLRVYAERPLHPSTTELEQVAATLRAGLA